MQAMLGIVCLGGLLVVLAPCRTFDLDFDNGRMIVTFVVHENGSFDGLKCDTMEHMPWDQGTLSPECRQ